MNCAFEFSKSVMERGPKIFLSKSISLALDHFEVAEKQKRVLHRKYGRKRPRVAVGESSNKATVGEDSNDDNAEWSPKWVDL